MFGMALTAGALFGWGCFDVCDCTDSLPLEGQPDPSVWSAVKEAFGSQQFSDYVTVDDDLVSSEQLTDEEIVAQIRRVPNAEQQDEDENEEGTSETVTEKVTTSQALDYIQGLKNYFEQATDPLAHVLDDTLPDICLGAQLNAEEQAAVKHIIRHVGLFSTSPEDIGIYKDVEQEIKLVPDAKPYGRQPTATQPVTDNFSSVKQQLCSRMTSSDHTTARGASQQWS
ncbi:hypothetical protein MTO96_030147 [Rhipicephalus appendiculatus]